MDSNKNTNILVVDDDTQVLGLMKRILNLHSYGNACAASAMEALQFMKTAKFDLIITDYQMPDMDGFEFYETIRKADKHISVIFYSSYLGEIKNKVNETGADENFALLEKPVRPSEMIELIRMLLEKP